MPNLTIKPVAAAGNKLILQDQAGNTRLQTDDAGITLTTPNLGTPSAVTLTNATFPAGHVTNSWYFSETDDGTYLVNATKTVSVDAVSWSAISGRKYFISTQISCRPYKGSENNVTIGMTTYADVGTTNRSQGDTTFDTQLGQGYIARNVFGSTTTVGGHMYTHWSPHLSFTAGSTATHYFYISALGSAGQNARIYNSSTDPWETIIMEVMP